MNILYLSRDYPPNLIGGVGVYVQEISHLLAQMGHKTFVITGTNGMPLEYTDDGVHVFRVKPKENYLWRGLKPQLRGFLERLEYSAVVSRKMKEVIEKYHIDVVETSEARAEGFWYYLTRKRPPLIIKLHTPETLAFKLDHVPQGLDYWLLKSIEDYWISRADCRVGISQEVVRLTSKHFGISLEATPLLPNPIDTGFFKPNGKKRCAHDILYVGRLEFRKGVHVLMRAFCRVQESCPEARLIFIGADCGMKGYLVKKQKELRFPERVIFIDQIERAALREYYCSCAVCVVPSIWENYPYVCLEALSCGAPVIASRIGGLITMIRNNINGLLVTPGSTRSLSKALLSLINNEEMRTSFSRAAREIIERDFSPEAVARMTLSLYESVLAKHA